MKINTTIYDDTYQQENKKIIRQSLLVGSIITLLVCFLSFFIKNLKYTSGISFLLGMLVSTLNYGLTCKIIYSVPVNELKKSVRQMFLFKSLLHLIVLGSVMFLFQKDVVPFMFCVVGLMNVKLILIFKELCKRKKK